MTLINHPATVAEVTELYLEYEAALCSNNLKIMDELFWNSADVVRFGLAENLYGTEEIRNFRNNRPSFQLQRQISHLQVITFGNDTASVTLEFKRIIDGVERSGRQSQMWYKFPQGWKVVSAHVSLID
ncbi:oxalurate catabolism protein HpxZ [Calothrix sp. PCC 6303]|uniref:oxalurate catabolism protein HpxZ n=1 Tax=Calothrix sp. PCC 6303 TaxID=1170562 RepID=UPI0002A04A24|nr:oxalurate catabolism protein HpxZ [Calothrix sp. PCC 6303]AFZ02815.1 hypothetical protein Cal6303_3898 [Calothrix sp. PCC 6303]